MKKTLTILFFALNQNISFAECTPKDLTNPEYLKSIGKENLIEQFKAPRDQDDVGWCGAYASSDSLSFAVGEPVSAIDVSINEYANTSSGNKRLPELYGISANSAITVAQVNGYCPESVIPSDQTSSSNLGHYALSQLMEAFQKISDDFKAKGKPIDYCVKCVTSDYEKIIQPALPNVTSDMIREILIKYQGDSLASIRELLNKLCSGQRKKVNPTVERYTKGGLGSKKVYTIFDEALDNDSMPSIGINTAAFVKPGILPGGDQDHEMIIVAKRPGSNGKCEYQVRNSWGRSCSYYKESIAAKCDPEKGAFWMGQDELQAGVQDIIVVKNMNPAKNLVLTKNSAENNSGNHSDADTSLSSNNDPSLPPNTDSSFPSLIQKGLESLGNLVSSIWQSFANFFKF